MTNYNGHKNYNHWNVSLWINNDETLYRMARFYARRYHNAGGRGYAAQAMLNALASEGITKTPDGAPYSKSSIRAAMVGIL